MNVVSTDPLQETLCPLGCRPNDQLVVKAHDQLHGLPGEFSVVKCSNCGLMRTNPRPNPQQIFKYYPDDYEPYLASRVREDRQRVAALGHLRQIVRSITNFNIRPLPKIAPGRMLEIGCASGAFLHQMARLGWDVHGIEPSPRAARAATDLGYQVFAGSLEAAPPPARPYDLIVGWMVLEHLHDPIGGLKRLFEWAKPSGWLAVSVPNADSFEFALFRHNWYALQVPTHLYHFTPETLQRIMRAAGWIPTKIYHQRVLTNLVLSTAYLLRSKHLSRSIGNALILSIKRRPALFNYFLFPFAFLFAALGQTGRMTIHARRQP